MPTSDPSAQLDSKIRAVASINMDSKIIIEYIYNNNNINT